jgi:hypothetical protein
MKQFGEGLFTDGNSYLEMTYNEFKIRRKRWVSIGIVIGVTFMFFGELALVYFGLD